MLIERLTLQATNRPIETIRSWLNNELLELDPPYQRGVVWGERRQQNLIKSLLMGVPVPSIIINDRGQARGGSWGDDYRYAVIDGKQRITAVQRFLDDELLIPENWVHEGLQEDWQYEIAFSEIQEIPRRRIGLGCTLQFAEGALRSLEEEQLVFDLVNFGGLAQGETDE